MQVKYTSDDVVVEINGMKCVGFADYNDHEKQILVDEGFQRMARKIAVLEQQRAELLEALKKCRFDSLNMSIDTWREIQETIQRIDQ